MSDKSSLPTASSPKVSVVVITYNHEKFIDQTIESIVTQDTIFPIEVLIGDDCSTDGTRAKIVEWERRYPHMIRPFLHAVNLGPTHNFNSIMKASRGEYIAMIEGDDYWSDVRKLQKQADCLDENQDASLCFHLHDVYNDMTERFLPSPAGTLMQGTDFSPKEMLSHIAMHTSTKMWRRNLLPHFEKCLKSRQFDCAINVLLALRGRVVRIDEVMSVYRLHAGGGWVGATKLNQDIGIYECLSLLYQNVPAYFRSEVMGALVGAQVEMIAEMKRQGDSRLLFNVMVFLKNLVLLKSRRSLNYLGWLWGLLTSRTT